MGLTKQVSSQQATGWIDPEHKGERHTTRCLERKSQSVQSQDDFHGLYGCQAGHSLMEWKRKRSQMIAATTLLLFRRQQYML
jgi:hypothetical protein